MPAFDVLEVARALQPLYGRRVHPDELVREAAHRLAALLGPVHLRLPGVLGPKPSGADPAEDGWAISFQYGGGPGQLVGSGRPPGPELKAALQLELERLAAYIDLLRATDSLFDRLEFRLRALHQIAQTLAIAREPAETESQIADFTRELFFAWWTALYRPSGTGTLEARVVRSLRGDSTPPAIQLEALAGFVPVGAESRAVSVMDRPDWLPSDVRALAPLDVGGARLGCLLLGERMNEEAYREDDLQLLGTLAHASAIALRNAELLEQLREQATLDDLTGLYNRRFFDVRLVQEVDRARRYSRPLSLILFDVDRFKSYNDEFGHTAGDLVLARIGAIVRADIRKADIACRYGGEEFALIAPETSPSQALRFAERIHGIVSGLRALAGIRRPITISAGVASFPENAATPAELVEAADRALYRAKAGGRDRIASA